MKRRTFIGYIAATLLLLVPFFASPVWAADPPAKEETAVFGMGCFWCSQSLFEKFVGVKKIVCGYAGGTTANPTYEEVCSGSTGHAEVVQITFDPSVITYSQLLEIFWEVHDPTTLNAQGADEGTNYRSLILYNSDEQKKLAEDSKAEAQKKFSSPITTEISPLKVFYPAEDYHQNYFRNHPDQPYCVYTISPKLEKLEKKAAELPPQVK